MEETKEPLGVTDEPVTEPVESEGRSEEEVAERPDESPDSDVKFDLKPPKGLEKEYKQLETQFRQAFIKNTSQKAEELRSIAQEKERLGSELAQHKAMIDDIRQHPEKLDAYKQVWGVHPQQPMPEFKSMDELVNYVEKRAEDKVRSAMDSKFNQYVQTKQYEERWVSGWETVAEKDPKAALYATLVKNELMNRDSQYLKGYNGTNETEVIEKTLKGIRGIFQKEMDQVKQDTIQQMKGKKQMTTEKATKSSTVSSGSLDKDSILAEAREMFGS